MSFRINGISSSGTPELSPPSGISQFTIAVCPEWTTRQFTPPTVLHTPIAWEVAYSSDVP
jgi:hypothetical protein